MGGMSSPYAAGIRWDDCAGYRIVEGMLPSTPAYDPVPKPVAQFVRQRNPWVRCEKIKTVRRPNR
jgi:hypothetical protein